MIQVDPEDAWLLEEYNWTISNTGYAITNVYFGYYHRKTVLLHHCIVGQPMWEGEEIDHINRDRADNRRCNLRYVTKSQQNQNTSRQPGLSGERNVYEENGRYRVMIRRDGYLHNLGTFGTLDEAVAERDEWLCHLTK